MRGVMWLQAVLIKGLTHPCSAICREIAGGEGSELRGPTDMCGSPPSPISGARGMTANFLADLALHSAGSLLPIIMATCQGPDSVETCRRFVSPVQPCPGLLGLFLASWVFMWAARMHAK